MSDTDPKLKSTAAEQHQWLSPTLVEQPGQPTDSAASQPPIASVIQPTNRHRVVRFRKPLLVAAVLLVLSVAAGAFYLHAHSFVPVQIATMPATRNVNDLRLVNELQMTSNHYRLRIKTPDKKLHEYSLAEIGMSVDIPSTLRQAHGQHGVLFWRAAKIPLTLKVNKAALTTFIGEHTVQATKPPTEAGLSVVNGKVAVSAEADGGGFSLPDAPQTIQTQAKQLNTKPLALTRGAIHPSITRQTLHVKQQQLSKIISQPVSFNIDGSTRQASPDNIARWLDLTPVPAAKTIDITVNSGKIAAYVEGLTSDYTTASSEMLTDV